MYLPSVNLLYLTELKSPDKILTHGQYDKVNGQIKII